VEQVLLAAGSPIAGGVFSAKDLDEAVPTELPATETGLSGEVTAYNVPFGPRPGNPSDAEVVLACDGRGVVAALSYGCGTDGVLIPELEIELGRNGVPVRRGVTRTPPGTPLPAPSPIALLTRPGGFLGAVGIPRRPTIDAAMLGPMGWGGAFETALAAIRQEAAADRVYGLVTDGRAAKAACSVDGAGR
jgi:gamma-glutamyltranspeptidase/glutathione hydrolase